jgi:3-deoxy-D-manno-octulosonate 8-phosphate phosphatase KdsC-like HAD superfamily phosphatase
MRKEKAELFQAKEPSPILVQFIGDDGDELPDLPVYDSAGNVVCPARGDYMTTKDTEVVVS